MYRLFVRRIGSTLHNFTVAEPLKHVSQLAETKLFSTARQTLTSFATRTFSVLPAPILSTPVKQTANKSSLLNVSNVWRIPSRTVTKFSLKSGKKNSVRATLRRFYRLDCGAWIRRFGGCNKGDYKKSRKRLWYHDQHVFCNKTQSIMLDKMVTPFWKKKKYYIDDPFEPYQVRHNLDWVLPYRRS